MQQLRLVALRHGENVHLSKFTAASNYAAYVRPLYFHPQITCSQGLAASMRLFVLLCWGTTPLSHVPCLVSHQQSAFDCVHIPRRVFALTTCGVSCIRFTYTGNVLLWFLRHSQRPNGSDVESDTKRIAIPVERFLHQPRAFLGDACSISISQPFVNTFSKIFFESILEIFFLYIIMYIKIN